MTKYKIQKYIKIINSFFIKIVLFIFYFLIIGIIAVFYKLIKKNTSGSNSYWEDFEAGKFDLEYFKSAY